MLLPDQNELLISVQTPERLFDAPLHYVVYDSNLNLLAASYMQVESAVKAISASIIERRSIKVGKNYLTPISGYRRKEKPVGIGDIYHGMIIPRHSVWADIELDEAENLQVNPIVFAFDGNLNQAVGEFLTKKFSLPDCWTDQFYGLLHEEHVEHLIVKVNPEFPVWQELKAVRLKISEAQMLNLVQEAMVETKQLTIPQTDTTTQGEFQVGWTMKDFSASCC